MSNGCVIDGVGVCWLIPLFGSVKPIPPTPTPTTTQIEAQHYRLFPVFRLCFPCPNPAGIGYASDDQQESCPGWLTRFFDV